MKFVELIWLCKQKEKPKSNQVSILINSCTELSKTQLFPEINIKKKIIFPLYVLFWYWDIQARWEILHREKWKMDCISWLTICWFEPWLRHYEGIFMLIQAYSVPCVTLTYSQLCHILSPGIFRTRGLFKTLWNIDQTYSEPCV